MEDKFVIQFPLSYGDFLKANGLSEVGTEQIEAWQNSVINKFQYDLTTTPEEIMDFFHIHDQSLKEIIRNRGFKISSIVSQHDTQMKVILFEYTLTFSGLILG